MRKNLQWLRAGVSKIVNYNSSQPDQDFDGTDDDANEEPLALVRWSDAAEELLGTLEPHLANNIRFRAEKRARRDDAVRIMPEHVTPFLEEEEAPAKIAWDAAAVARLTRVPEKVRERTKFLVEEVAQEQGAQKVDFDLAEKVISDIRSKMCPVPEDEG